MATTLQTLLLNENKISDLTALENLVNLVEINLDTNNIVEEKSLTVFMKLTKVKLIHLARNPVFDHLAGILRDKEYVVHKLKFY